MEKKIAMISAILILASLCGMLLAQNAGQDRAVIIVMGENASSADSNTATRISQSLRLEQDMENVTIVRTNDFFDDGTSDIIALGGSCVNKISAELLDVNYPSCGNSFESKTNVGPNEYLFATFALTNDRMAVLIAGYEGDDTSQGANYFLDRDLDSLNPGVTFIGNSTNMTRNPTSGASGSSLY